MDDEYVVSDWNVEETRNVKDFVLVSYVSWGRNASGRTVPV